MIKTEFENTCLTESTKKVSCSLKLTKIHLCPMSFHLCMFPFIQYVCALGVKNWCSDAIVSWYPQASPTNAKGSLKISNDVPEDLTKHAPEWEWVGSSFKKSMGQGYTVQEQMNWAQSAHGRKVLRLIPSQCTNIFMAHCLFRLKWSLLTAFNQLKRISINQKLHNLLVEEETELGLTTVVIKAN